MSDVNAFIALNRFGLGARPGDLEEISSDPDAWLRSQVSKSAALAPTLNTQMSSAEIVKDIFTARVKKDKELFKDVKKKIPEKF